MAANTLPGADDAPTASIERDLTLRAVTVIMTAVVGLTFLFGFGNVWTLALRLGVPVWVAPLVAPAVDLSVIGLLLGTRYLALHGASAEQLRPARRLLVFSSVMTLALNVTDPLLAGQTGKAAFDAVGPLLLIGWSEVGPGLLQAISGTQGQDDEYPRGVRAGPRAGEPAEYAEPAMQRPHDDLLERARQEDARHRARHQRPISAETLRKQLQVGAARSRMLVAMIRGNGSEGSAIEAGRPHNRAGSRT